MVRDFGFLIINMEQGSFPEAREKMRLLLVTANGYPGLRGMGSVQ